MSCSLLHPGRIICEACRRPLVWIFGKPGETNLRSPLTQNETSCSAVMSCGSTATLRVSVALYFSSISEAARPAFGPLCGLLFPQKGVWRYLSTRQIELEAPYTHDGSNHWYVEPSPPSVSKARQDSRLRCSLGSFLGLGSTPFLGLGSTSCFEKPHENLCVSC